jgi:hypothetical protein
VANFLKFLKAAGYIGWGSVGFAIVLLAISIVEHLIDKNVNAYWLVFIGALAFAFGAYRAWASEHEAFENELAKNAKPSLKIETPGVFFDISTPPDVQKLVIRLHVYAYLRVTNLTPTDTTIKDGYLVMTVGGVQYKALGDDIDVQGNALEHISTFRTGGETTTSDIFGKHTLTTFKRLMSVVNSTSPLKRGIPQEGFFVFTFTDQSIDWDHGSSYSIPVADFVLTLRDSFDGHHEHQVTVLNIPESHLKS